MGRHHAPPSHAPRRRPWLALGLLTSLTVGTLTTTALLTDTQAVSGNAVSTAVIDFRAAPSTVLYGTLGPGDAVTRAVTINNASNIPMRYAAGMTANGGGDLSAAGTRVAVRTGVSSCTNAGFRATGAALADVAPSGSGDYLFGNAAAGQQTGDRVLAANTAEVLCVQIYIPADSSNNFDTRAGQWIFYAGAEQVTNNP